MEERFAEVGRGVTLCYEEFGSSSDPPLLLIQGLGVAMTGWHEDFCRELAGRGFHVVRFDNRDTGRSTWMKGPPPNLLNLATRKPRPGQYLLADMAADAAGLLEQLELAPAHVVGVSMGGMIAQTLAARHPQLVRSLTSIMSNTGARWSGQPALGAYRHLLAIAPKDRAGFVEHSERLFRAIGTKGEHADLESVREMAGLQYDRGLSRAGTGRQLGAITASGNREQELRAIEAPTLVLHGKQDILVQPSGGRATARAIPGARLIEIDGMGHDLPRPLWPTLIGEIASHAQAVDETSDADRTLAA